MFFVLDVVWGRGGGGILFVFVCFVCLFVVAVVVLLCFVCLFVCLCALMGEGGGDLHGGGAGGGHFASGYLVLNKISWGRGGDLHGGGRGGHFASGYLMLNKISGEEGGVICRGGGGGAFCIRLINVE